MKLSNMNWYDVEKAVARDKRCILPIGSTEQHAQLSLSTDTILAERVALDAAEPLQIPVYPAIAYGLAPYFSAYPGTVTLRVDTLMALVSDVVSSMRQTGFQRILIVNAHGGNVPLTALAQELMAQFGDISVKMHNWWNAPRLWDKVQELDPTGSHANWMENYPWTRLEHAPAPEEQKPCFDFAMMRACPPEQVRELIGDGSFGGPYQRSDADMLKLWQIGVEETQKALEGPWPDLPAS